MWECRLLRVQRFAIITFRACRFVCINSVRQFPLCGVHSRASISLLSLLSLSSLRLVDDFVGREEARKKFLGVPRLVPREREREREREEGSFPGRICYPGIGKRFIFLALFSSNVRYSSLAVALSHVCTRSASGSASVSS